MLLTFSTPCLPPYLPSLPLSLSSLLLTALPHDPLTVLHHLVTATRDLANRCLANLRLSLDLFPLGVTLAMPP